MNSETSTNTLDSDDYDDDVTSTLQTTGTPLILHTENPRIVENENQQIAEHEIPRTTDNENPQTANFENAPKHENDEMLPRFNPLTSINYNLLERMQIRPKNIFQNPPNYG